MKEAVCIVSGACVFVACGLADAAGNGDANRSEALNVPAIRPNRPEIDVFQLRPRILAWGENQSGQLGDGTNEHRSAPVPIGLLTAKQVASGGGHSLTLTKAGQVWAWGANDKGQLGDGTAVSRNTPAPVEFDASMAGQIEAVFAGIVNSAVLFGNGQVAIWGANYWGALGNGEIDHEPHPRPRAVSGLKDIKKVTMNYGGVLALRKDGSLWAWGHNAFGELGDLGGGAGSYTLKPTRILESFGPIADVDTKWHHTLLIREDGERSAWALGRNELNQFGTGAPDEGFHAQPVRVGSLRGVESVSAGFGHSLALLAMDCGTTQVWGWGYNPSIQAGDASGGTVSSPIHIPGLDGVSKISAGAYHNAALRDGAVWMWGSNRFGELGQGSVSCCAMPVLVPGLSNVTALAAGSNHVLAFGSFSAPPSDRCTNGILDGDETDVDCGGHTSCVRCTSGKACIDDSDCEQPQTCFRTPLGGACGPV